MRDQIRVAARILCYSGARNAYAYFLREARRSAFTALCPHTRSRRVVGWKAFSAGFAHEYLGPMRDKEECLACGKVLRDVPASNFLANWTRVALSQQDPVFIPPGDSISIGYPEGSLPPPFHQA